MASQFTSPTVLGLSECWNEKVKTKIKGFLSEKGEKLSVVCTVLDDKIEERVEQDALQNDVSLIHGKRNEYSNPRLDPPSPTWLLNYENYYPEIQVLQNVKYIIGLSQLTEPAAKKIYHKLFPDAIYVVEQYSDQGQNPGALFVFDSWDKRSCSLRAFHRVLIKDLSARKKEKLDVYTTVLATDSDISECQKRDAQNSCVTLITAKRNPWLTESEDPANMLWLMNYQCYYPELKTLTNIRYVIGYAPKTGRAAAEIKKNLFPDAKLVLINHRNTDLDGHMLKLASEADMLFSIGPKLHEDLNNAYRGGDDEISLTEIPHEEILPKPSELNKKCAKLSEKTNRRYVLTYPWKMESEEQLSRCEEMAAAITFVVNREKDLFQTPLKWSIFGSTKEKENEIISHFAMKLKQGCIKPTFVKGSSRDEIRTGLKQSHICLITAWDEEYGFDGLEAMALGIPFLAPDHEQIAEFLRKHFDLYFEHSVVRNNENWGEKILQVLHTDLEASFRRAEGFKQDFKESEDVLESYTRFAAFLPTEKGKDNVQEATAKDGLKVVVAINETNFQVATSGLVNGEHGNTSKEKQKLTEEKIGIALSNTENGFRQRSQVVLKDETEREALIQICKNNSADYTGGKEGSMVIELKFSCLENASKFEAKHKSYRFHRDLEGLLFTEEMKREASNVNVQLKLSVTFDAAEMAAIKRFFLKRDGGETPNVYLTSSDEELDDQYSEEDMKTNSDGINAKPATDSHNDTRLQSVEERHTGREVNIARAIGDLERTTITGRGTSGESESTSRSTSERVNSYPDFKIDPSHTKKCNPDDSPQRIRTQGRASFCSSQTFESQFKPAKSLTTAKTLIGDSIRDSIMRDCTIPGSLNKAKQAPPRISNVSRPTTRATCRQRNRSSVEYIKYGERIRVRLAGLEGRGALTHIVESKLKAPKSSVASSAEAFRSCKSRHRRSTSPKVNTKRTLSWKLKKIYMYMVTCQGRPPHVAYREINAFINKL